MQTIRTFALGLLVAIMAIGSANADMPTKFFGKFAGEAKTTFDAKNKGVGKERKVAVDIKATQGGRFQVSWTTNVPGNKEIDKRLRTTTFEFTPTGNPAIWRALKTGNPLFGQALIWARLSGQTMTIYIVGMINDGVMVTAMYRRVVKGDTMTLEFERTEDGKRRRAVAGTLKRVKG